MAGSAATPSARCRSTRRLASTPPGASGSTTARTTSNRWLNAGDSITLTLGPVGWRRARYASASFTASRGGAAGSATLALDIDGDVMRTGSYKASADAGNVDALLQLAVNDGDRVAIDFDAGTVSVPAWSRKARACPPSWRPSELATATR